MPFFNKMFPMLEVVQLSVHVWCSTLVHRQEGGHKLVRGSFNDAALKESCWLLEDVS